MRRVLLVLVLLAAAMPLGNTVASSQPVTLAAAGDIARASFGAPQQQTADLITGLGPAAVLALGDEQYPKGELTNFQRYYDASWGAFKADTYPVPGNHEYKTAGAAGYYAYFGGAAGDPSKGYYSFNLGDWHILAINTNCGDIDCGTEKTWVSNDLAADDHLCELAFYHHTDRSWPRNLMESAGGDVVLAGHKHVYEREPVENGLLRFTVGTGGYSLGTLDSTADFGARAYGVIEMTLDATGYSWAFVDVNGKTLDSGSRSCH